MLIVHQFYRRHGSLFFISLLLSFLAGCAGVKLISAYDEVTDRSLSDIQQKTDDFIVDLISKAKTEDAAFDRHHDFYEGIDRDLRRLEFRVSAIPNNSRTVKLVQDIRAAILGDGTCSPTDSSLRSLHCLPENALKGPSVLALKIARRNINQTISAALNLELAKRQGSNPEK